MMRKCPECSSLALPIGKMLFGDTRCKRCRSIVGVHRIASMGFSTLIIVVTLITTVMVLAQLGLFAALLWFSCPIGALSYMKARFSPLEKRRPGTMRRHEVDA